MIVLLLFLLLLLYIHMLASMVYYSLKCIKHSPHTFERSNVRILSRWVHLSIEEIQHSAWIKISVYDSGLFIIYIAPNPTFILYYSYRIVYSYIYVHRTTKLTYMLFNECHLCYKETIDPNATNEENKKTPK